MTCHRRRCRCHRCCCRRCRRRRRCHRCCRRRCHRCCCRRRRRCHRCCRRRCRCHRCCCRRRRHEFQMQLKKELEIKKILLFGSLTSFFSHFKLLLLRHYNGSLQPPLLTQPSQHN